MAERAGSLPYGRTPAYNHPLRRPRASRRASSGRSPGPTGGRLTAHASATVPSRPGAPAEAGPGLGTVVPSVSDGPRPANV